MRSLVICSCFGMNSSSAEGEECFSPTSKIADTKSRCKSSGQVNRFDQRPSEEPFLRPFLSLSRVRFRDRLPSVVLSVSDAGGVGC